MISAFIHGLGGGLVLSIMIGPVFFGLIQTSIQKGFKSGMRYACGVSLSDISYIFLTYFGISALVENPPVKKMVTLAGGGVTILFGLYYLAKPVSREVPAEALKNEKSKSNEMYKGFFLNFLNPSVLFFWIATVSLVTVNYASNQYRIISFFTGTILALFSTDVLKSFVAHKIKRFLTPRILSLFNKVVGIVFVLAGLFVLINNFPW